eukprot:GEZU01016326.1.p1 GENE.GEZU01016326.1~~GEZU01016326.1.p1  ORF type:complete len:101 (-),score=10.46 GEZU01016326.1:468-749(-)
MGKQNDIQREADVIVDSICQKLYRKGANLRAELHKFSVARDGTTSKHELCKVSAPRNPVVVHQKDKTRSPSIRLNRNLKSGVSPCLRTNSRHC